MSIEFIPMVYLEPGWTGIYDMAYCSIIYYTPKGRYFFFLNWRGVL